jgi:hypothetical protein
MELFTSKFQLQIRKFNPGFPSGLCFRMYTHLTPLNWMNWGWFPLPVHTFLLQHEDGGGGRGRGVCERRTKWLARHGCRLHKEGFLKSRTGSEGAAVGRGSKNFSLSKTLFFCCTYFGEEIGENFYDSGLCGTVFLCLYGSTLRF